MRRFRAVMPVELPRGIARFNKVLTNPVQLRYAWLLPPWAVIVHRGRRSGQLYRTPVTAYKRGRTLAAPILYGERSDWVQNVLSGGGQVVRGGRTYELGEPRVLDARQAPGISLLARLTGRLSGKVLVAALSEPMPSFGAGPRE